MTQEFNTLDIFGKCRHHLFSNYNKFGDLDNSINYVLKGGLYPLLDKPSLVGLEAELKVFDMYKDDWNLTPALDSGDHTDFTGVINKEQVRLDVTTNPEYKKLQDYEKFQKEGKRYLIVNLNIKNEEVELIDINFPFCECGGRLMKMIVLSEINVSTFYTGSITQSLITVCSNNPQEHYTIEENYNSVVPSSNDIGGNVRDLFAIELENSINEKSRIEAQKMYELETEKQIRLNFNDVANLFKTKCNYPISVISEENYHVLDRDGSGLHDTLVVWSSDIVKKLFPTDVFLENIYGY